LLGLMQQPAEAGAKPKPVAQAPQETTPDPAAQIVEVIAGGVAEGVQCYQD